MANGKNSVGICDENRRSLHDWLLNAANFAGDFLKSIAWAGLRADGDNYPVLRPALLFMKSKYPEYAQHYTGLRPDPDAMVKEDDNQ
jgi:hypothetical protein